MKNILRRVRREHDESQEELARAVGVSRQAIINIEKERVIPNGALMLAIARHYRKGADEIFFEDVVIHGEHKRGSA